MQTVIMDEIRKVVEARGAELVVQYKYSNLGTLYVRNGLTTIAAKSFNFQSDSCTFTEVGQPVTSAALFADYDKDAEVKKLLAYFAGLFPAAGDVFTVIGFYEDTRQRFADSVCAKSVEEAEAAVAAKGVSVVATLRGDIEAADRAELVLEPA